MGAIPAGPPDYLKINVDGEVFFDNYKAGIDMILRDENGETIQAASIAELGVKEPEDLELLAILKGLQLCLRMGIKKIIIESDCL